MGPDTVTAFERFLAYGPLGLAGLMLVLVICALAMGRVTPARERLLKFMMGVGLVCFLASLGAQFFSAPSEHLLRMRVLPQGLAGGSVFPLPSVSMNGQDVAVGANGSSEMTIADQTSMLVDVSEAMGVLERFQIRVEAQADTLRTQHELLEEAADINATMATSLSETRSITQSVIDDARIQQLQGLQMQLQETLAPYRR